MNHLHAIILGLVEGITEFLPISSTGHLILVQALLGGQTETGKLFDIVIQLGAILAVCALYLQRLWHVLLRLPHDPLARKFILSLLLAFLPAAVIGAALHNFITRVLFSPLVVAVAMIAGGVAIIVIERWFNPPDRYQDSEAFPLPLAVKIGFMQCLALIPGVSRSGATIMGGLLLGASRRAATEFSFFLAIPVMVGATTFDLYTNRHLLSASSLIDIAIGFSVAFLSALLVVKWLIGFIARHNFTPFGWYRIVAGFAIVTILLFT